VQQGAPSSPEWIVAVEVNMELDDENEEEGEKGRE
jgi:hypothetical protein